MILSGAFERVGGAFGNRLFGGFIRWGVGQDLVVNILLEHYCRSWHRVSPAAREVGRIELNLLWLELSGPL